MPQSDGRALEALVAQVERLHLPDGADVTVNRKQYDARGVQVAEFDIEIRGIFGSTKLAWLIECRDRPSEGACGGEWIEQLAGRRDRFGFNKVTAVSTTGFSAGAIAEAKRVGIELRAVKSLAPEEFAWLQIRTMQSQKLRLQLQQVKLILDESETQERKAALRTALDGKPRLFMRRSGAAWTPEGLFKASCTERGLLDSLVPNAGPTTESATLHVTADEMLVATALGDVRILAVECVGSIALIETNVPLAETVEYGAVEDGVPISQSARFDVKLSNKTLSVQIDRLSNTGEAFVSVTIKEIKPSTVETDDKTLP